MAQEHPDFIQQCKDTLAGYWQDILDQDLTQDYLADEQIRKKIADSIRSKTKTYRYVLPTQLLAKVVNRNLDSKCLQVKRTPDNGNFDARSVNAKVIVTFERDQGSPLGGSPEPYVNNPLRVNEVSPVYLAAQKDQAGWQILCDLLERVETEQDPDLTVNLFKQTLLEIRRVQQEMDVTYPIPQRISHANLLNILDQYLEPRTGGSRLQAVIMAAFKTLRDIWNIYDDVISAPVNAADAAGNRPADIACKKEGETILAVEVKDRTLNIEMLTDKITSTRLAHVAELLFLIRANPLIQNEEVEDRARREFAGGGNIYILEVNSFFKNILALIGETGRQQFLSQVCSALDELNLDFQDKKDWSQLLGEC